MDDIRIEGRIPTALDAALGEKRSALLALGLVAALTGIALLVILRESPARVAPPSSYASWSPSDVASGAPTAGGVNSMFVGEAVMVHVAGAVKAPGLYSLPVGSRVADAVEAAGGPTVKADLGTLNLAQLVLDGTKVEVLRKGSMPQAAPLSQPGSLSSSPSIISLNSADQAALETIPGIGPVTAEAILQHRDEIGGFTSLEQLLDVSGIGPATYESMRDFISL
ncbi:MAG: helix-hairpin-helix domain-containing protein [Actinomycetota bacterium]